MSHWASTWAYEQPIKLCGRKFVLVALASFADEDGFCYPAQETLAGMTGQDARSVRRHLAELEKSGYVRRQHRYDKKKRTSDGYHILAPAERLNPYRTDDPVAYRTNQPVDKLSADPSEDKDEQSVKKEPPLPPKGKSVKSFKPTEPLFGIEQLEDPATLPGIENQLSAFGLEFAYVYRQWYLKYFRLGGIGRAKGSLATARQYAASLESYFATWARNEAARNTNGNGNHQDIDDDRPIWMASKK